MDKEIKLSFSTFPISTRLWAVDHDHDDHDNEE
jgi:hypothetical protein